MWGMTLRLHEIFGQRNYICLCLPISFTICKIQLKILISFIKSNGDRHLCSADFVEFFLAFCQWCSCFLMFEMSSISINSEFFLERAMQKVDIAEDEKPLF